MALCLAAPAFAVFVSSTGVRAGERADPPLMPLASRSELLTRTYPTVRSARAVGAVTPSHGVSRPTTHEARGSDYHRVCLARLRCAFRFSQPLDAFFRLQPFRPCFVPVAPLGFRLQRFSPRGSEILLPVDPCPPRRYAPASEDLRAPDPEDLRTRAIRFSGHGVSRVPEPVPLLALFPPRYHPRRSRPPRRRGNLHSWA